MIVSISALAIAFLIAWQLARLFASGRGPRIMDHPNERSLHDTPTPRSGGLAILAGLATGQALLLSGGGGGTHGGSIVLAAAVVFAISVADDLRPLPAAVRLLVHLLAAGILVAGGLTLTGLAVPGAHAAIDGLLATGLTVLLVVWMTNLYNFMDGMDGFAGGMGVIGFAAFAVLAWRGGDGGLAARCAVVAAACAGFLLLNLPPARLFMGDAGSSVLGLVAGAVALDADSRGVFPLWIALLVFSPFVVDATVTLVRRGLAGEAVWRAHRSHFYQRLVQLGWGHQRTVRWEYGLMVACAVSAVALQGLGTPVQLAVLCGWVLVYTMLMVGVTKLERASKG